MIEVELTPDEVELLVEGLDSHRYWQLSDTDFRNSGYVLPPGSYDPETVVKIKATEELEDKLRAASDEWARGSPGTPSSSDGGRE